MSVRSEFAKMPVKMSVSLAPTLRLSNPFVAASGALGFGEAAELTDFAVIGAFVTPTLTLEPRLGAAMPRTAEASTGLIHATGLPNPGLECFVAENLPNLREIPCPLIVSIAGRSGREWAQLATTLEQAGGVIALELNLTPFSLHEDGYRAGAIPSESESLQAIEYIVRTVRAAVSLPLIAKLPAVGAEVGRAATAAVFAGADIIAVAQALPGVAVRLNGGSFRLPGVVGGVSGPCIKPMALYQVWRVAQCVSVPIIGMGGIMTGEDAAEFLIAGATAVGVGVANLIHPSAIAQMARDLEGHCATNRLAAVKELSGKAI